MRKTGRRPGLATAESSPRQSCSRCEPDGLARIVEHLNHPLRLPAFQTSISEGLTPPAALEKPPGPFGVAAALQAFTSSNFRDLPASPSVRGAGTYEQPGAIRRNALEG